jgi:glycine/D-amino acid oxidase-like deaminating enzyme
VEPPASLWWSTLDDPVVARPALDGDLSVDVAIVGGGFTGLWSAREILRRDPSVRVAVLEREVCGFGASGRNGGWASGLFPVADDAVRHHYGNEAADHLRHVLWGAVEGLGEALRADGIDAHYRRGGTLTLARSDVQATRLRQGVAAARERGVAEADFAWLEREAALERVGATQVEGATFTPHCARIHPARAARGLAAAAERAGARLFEGTAVTRIVEGGTARRPRVLTAAGTVEADVVVRATEGFTATLPGRRRELVPLYSLMIATEPLSAEFWSQAGLGDYETFADDRHLIIYGQRTDDDRLAFGGRGAPYHFGSTVEPRFDLHAPVFAALERTLHELFDHLDGEVTHRWGGPLAMPRDQWPSVVVDRGNGLAQAGGYTGDGVVLSYVAANALADLIVDPEADTAWTRLPFVHRSSPRWPVEPLRWLGINLGLALATWADHHEAQRGSESRASALLDRLFDEFPP